MKHYNFIPTMLTALCICACSETNETKPYTRWWWMGSAVDIENIDFNLKQIHDAGIGGVEITPIYGVQNNDANEIDFLSPKWMEMYSHTLCTAKKLGLQVDMNCGTGWPFGGPEVTLEDAATCSIFQEYALKAGQKLDKTIMVEDEEQRKNAVFERLMAFRNDARLDLTDKVKDGMLEWTAPEGGEWRLIALFVGKTLQEVNRAAPGGEGLVMDHYSSTAVRHYLDKFEKAFDESGAKYPDSFFNDSYEVYGADWTPGMLDEFEKRRGYKLEYYFPEFLDQGRGRSEVSNRVISDYRETMSDLLKENFTKQWTDWAHEHGVRTRNQAHGSPGNLIDLYAIVDIPECEGFGLSDFGIDGLHKDDPYTRKNDCDLSMLKYASSGAHISGKPLCSSETFTWLTEHFRTSLAQCKPDLDLMFVSGVNHIFYHGTCYSPKDDPWPGWKFYASIDMSPTNPQWRQMPEFDNYVTNCQQLLKSGLPDNDFLLYLPIYDIWARQEGSYLAFEIDHMDTRAPEFIKIVNTIDRCGFDVDYISDDFVRTTRYDDGSLITSGGSKYKALVVPSTETVPYDVMSDMMNLANNGADLIFIGRYPSTVPGLNKLEERQSQFNSLIANLPEADFSKTEIHKYGEGRIITGSDYSATLQVCGARAEDLKTEYGLHCIRRKTEGGHCYFVSALKSGRLDAWVTLGRSASFAELYDPMTGMRGMARTRDLDGKTQVYLQLESGASLFINCYDTEKACKKAKIDLKQSWNYLLADETKRTMPTNGWEMSFVESTPEIDGSFHMDRPFSWTELDAPDVTDNFGTARYKALFKVEQNPQKEYVLHLGDVRESAKVWVNGKYAGCCWSVPFQLRVGDLLKKGDNLVEIEVTNLPANRIAHYDRKGIIWRKFKNANSLNIHYEPNDYSDWKTVDSGLCSEVWLSEMKCL